MSDLAKRLRYADQDLDHGEIAKVKLACWEAHERIEALEAALQWYGEQARLCRLIHSEGDQGRHALADDGGERAASLLEKKGLANEDF